MDPFQNLSQKYLERYWHSKPAAWLAPVVVFLALAIPFYSSESGDIAPLGIVLSLLSASIVAVIWKLTNRIPKAKKGQVAIVVGILADSPDHASQVKADFISNLRVLAHQGDSKLSLIELPHWCLTSLEDEHEMGRLLVRARGAFLLYGRVRLRTLENKQVHLLTLDGMVRHRPIAEAVQKELADDFARVIPRKVVIEKNNDAFSFEATSAWTEVAARYIVGMAAFLSGDPNYAEKQFLLVEKRLATNKSSHGAIQIARKLPARFAQLYEVWRSFLYGQYF